MLELDASDLHLTVGIGAGLPYSREARRRRPTSPTLDPETTRQAIYSILTSEQQKQLELDRQIDFAYSLPGIARFRVNAFFQRGSVGAAFRLVPGEIRTLEELGLPPVLHTLAEKPRGLVLVTGPTGSGKSTTLAAIVDEINRHALRPHPHDRGSDRVPPPPQEVHRQPARDRHRRDGRSPKACAPRSARIPTSCSSARCATSRRSRRRSPRRRPVTSSSARCTRRPRRRRSTASSTSSRRRSSSRCAS